MSRTNVTSATRVLPELAGYASSSRNSRGVMIVAAIARYRVIATSAPGVTAADSLYSKPAPFEDAVLTQRIDRVFGACRVETAIHAEPARLNALAISPP
jgi:hypothetical protein